MTENELSKILVNIFLKVHRTLGPGLKLGLLVNFNVELIKHGITRKVNKLLSFAPLAGFAGGYNIEIPILKNK